MDERIYQALRNADAAGDTAAAKRLAEYIRSNSQEQPQVVQQPSAPTQNKDTAPEGSWEEPKERSWGNTAKNFVSELPDAAYQVGKGVVQAVSNPMQTLQGVSGLIVGGLDKLGQAVGNPPLASRPNTTVGQAQALGQSEAMVNALADKYVQNYGSMAGFKEMLANNPEDFLLDASTVFTGGAGLAGKGTTAGNVMSKVATATNPLMPVEVITNALAKGGSKAAGFVSDAASGKLPKLAAGKALTEANPNIQSIAAQLAKDKADLAQVGAKLRPEFKEPIEARIRDNQFALEQAAKNAQNIASESNAIPEVPSFVRHAMGAATAGKSYITQGATKLLNNHLQKSSIRIIDEGVKSGKSMDELFTLLPTSEQNKLLKFLKSNPQYLTQPGVAPAANAMTNIGQAQGVVNEE